MPPTVDGALPVKISGVALRIRPEDQMLVDDLRAKGIPETDIAAVLTARQAADSDSDND